MRHRARQVIKHEWRLGMGLVKYRWPVLVLFGALCLPVDVSGFGRVSRVLIGACLVVGFMASLILAECRRVGAASERQMGRQW